MGNALWLLLAVPVWYFGCIRAPFAAGPLTFIPAAGVVCLAVGTAVGLIRRQRQLLTFLFSFGLTELFVAAAGLLRGRLQGRSHVIDGVEIGFVVVQIVLVSYLVYQSRNSRREAVALTVFALTYALLGTFVAAMSFSDTWV